VYGNWHCYSVFLPIPCYPLIVPAPRSSHQRWPQALVISGYIFCIFLCFWSFHSTVMSCHSTSQNNKIYDYKSFSLALSQKSLAKQSVRAVHLIGTPHTKLLRFTSPWPVPDFGMELTLARTWHDFNVSNVSKIW
jgi:hypothetical protein